MKVRAGFVANSSSSSFIFAIKDFPKSKSELQERIFGKNKYIHYDDRDVDTKQLSHMFYDELIKLGPITTREAFEIMCEGFIYGIDYHTYCNTDDIKGIDKETAYEIKSIRVLKQRKKLLRDFIDKNGETLYTATFSDDDGVYGSALEHEIATTSFPCIHISKH
jgi:hypothetical protein